jgi:hypothetical protein
LVEDFDFDFFIKFISEIFHDPSVLAKLFKPKEYFSEKSLSHKAVMQNLIGDEDKTKMKEMNGREKDSIPLFFTDKV